MGERYAQRPLGSRDGASGDLQFTRWAVTGSLAEVGRSGYDGHPRRRELPASARLIVGVGKSLHGQGARSKLALKRTLTPRKKSVMRVTGFIRETFEVVV
jgi:hypothetical protein